MTSPRGPVYLMLPREPLAAPLAEPLDPAAARGAGAAASRSASIETLARWIAAAERPLIITAARPRSRAVEALA